MFLALLIDARIISIFDLPSGFVLLMWGVLILDLILYNAFFSMKLGKKLYLSVVTVLLILIAITCNLVYGIYYSLNIFYLALIITGLIIALLCTILWDKKLLLKYIRDNDFQKVLVHSNKMLKGDPNNYFALSSKANALRMIGKYSDALEVCESFLEKNSSDWYLLNIKVDVLINLQQLDEAEEINEKLLLKDSKDMFALENKGQILFERGLYQESIEYFEDALNKMPDKRKMGINGIKTRKINFSS